MKQKLLVFLLVLLLIVGSFFGCSEDLVNSRLESQAVSSVEETSKENSSEEISSYEQSSEEAVSYEESSAEHVHNFTNVTCTNPEICTECGEIGAQATGHDWKDATCTTPKTCKACGKVDGDALGHTWVAATCTEAKTCSVCKMTDGNALGHNYYDETCTRCNKKNPNSTADPMVWISKTGTKYHSNSSCSNMKNPSQISLSQAKKKGLTACSKCY